MAHRRGERFEQRESDTPAEFNIGTLLLWRALVRWNDGPDAPPRYVWGDEWMREMEA